MVAVGDVPPQSGLDQQLGGGEFAGRRTQRCAGREAVGSGPQRGSLGLFVPASAAGHVVSF